MIAQRFRALGWVAGIASAATGLYLISLQVAAERAKLEEVDRRIAAAHRDMRQLQTELGTRASLRQLEKFNAETLALSAPRASQYVHGDTQLAALTMDATAPSANPLVAVATVVAARAEPTQAPVATAPSAPRPIPAVIRRAAVPPAAQHIAPNIAPNVERVAYSPAPTGRMDRVAMVERAVVDRGTLGDLLRAAARERRKDR